MCDRGEKVIVYEGCVKGDFIMYYGFFNWFVRYEWMYVEFGVMWKNIMCYNLGIL